MQSHLFNPRGRSGQLAVGILIALLVSGVIFLMDRAGWLTALENKAYDGLIYARAKTRSLPTPNSPIVIIGIDDRTWDDPTFAIPQILWNDYFAAVIQGLTQAEAKVIGLDFMLPRASFDKRVPNYGRVWLRALNLARLKNTPVVTGVVQTGNRILMPEARYLQIIGPENIGVFNLTNDSDDFIRRQKLFLLAKDSSVTDFSFGYLLAKAFCPDLTPPAEWIYIDYWETSKPFQEYSFSDVYRHVMNGDAEFLKERFHNKVVLIGETDSQTADRHATPLYYLSSNGRQRLSGVEIWAHFIDTLLGNRIFREISAAGRWAIYFSLSIIVGMATVMAAHRLWPVVFPVMLLGYGAVSLWAFHHHVILPLATGVLGLVVSQTGAFTFRYWWVDKEKRHVRQAFARYLSPEVVSEIVSKPHLLSLGGSRREMTVFFSDLAGFTSISEALSPEDLVALLNRYLSRMTNVILKWGGTLDKYEGDAIMAFWGAPAPQSDHALRACLAALEQQKEVEKFRREIVEEGLPAVHVRMGVNTGPMIVGNMGSEEHFDYTVMGDAVNLASRLEGANKAFGSRIMISEFTYSQIGQQVEVRELDLLRVKGKSQPIRVFELLSLAGGLDDSRVRVRKYFMEGLELYRAKRFVAAYNEFSSGLSIDPEDGPSKAYMERCRRFQADPPPEDWDGVFTLTAK